MASGEERPKFYLPEDVTANILSRLPVKSLFRFKCICREWRTLISSSYFTSMHLNHSISNPSRQSILCHHYSQSKFIPFDPVSFSPRTNYFNLFLDQACNIEDDMRVVGSINGVLCICWPSSGWVCLWNPATKMLRKIRTGVTSELNHLSIGFGFDPIAEDYKVVVIYSSRAEWPVAVGMCLKVWSAKLESWRDDRVDSKFILWWCTCDVILNGFVYWIVRDYELVVDQVALFNMNTEVLRLVPTPEISDPTYEHRCEYSLRGFIWKENFAWLLLDPLRKQFQAWTLENDTPGKEYWRKIFTFRIQELQEEIPGPILPINFENGKIMYLCSYKEWILFDLETREKKSTAYFRDTKYLLASAHHYVESLVSIKGFKPIVENENEIKKRRRMFLDDD